MTFRLLTILHFLSMFFWFSLSFKAWRVQLLIITMNTCWVCTVYHVPVPDTLHTSNVTLKITFHGWCFYAHFTEKEKRAVRELIGLRANYVHICLTPNSCSFYCILPYLELYTLFHTVWKVHAFTHTHTHTECDRQLSCGHQDTLYIRGLLQAHWGSIPIKRSSRGPWVLTHERQGTLRWICMHTGDFDQ